MEAVADIISLHDSCGCFLSVTPSLFRLTGYTVEETLGCSLFDFVHPEGLPRLLAGIRAIIDPHSYRVKWHRLHNNGGYVWMESSIPCVLEGDGKVHRFVCSTRDIEARKQTEAILRDE